MPLLDRELTVADPAAQSIGKFGGCLFTIGGDELGKRREETCLCEAIAVDSVVARFCPCFLEIAERHALLVAVGNWLVRVVLTIGRCHFSRFPGP